MKKIFFLLFLTTCNLKAQKIEATLSLSPKEPRPLWFDYCRRDKGLVTIAPISKTSKRNIGIYKYDENFKRQWVQTAYEQTLNSDIVNLSVIGENIFLFVKETYNKEQIIKIFHYDIHGNRIKEYPSVLKTTAPSEFSPFKLVKSFNTQRFVGFTHSTENHILDFRYVTYSDLDQTLQEGKFEIPFYAEDLEIFQVEISNQGNIFFLSKQKKAKGRSDVEYVLYKYQPDSQKISSVNLYVENHYIVDVIFKLDKNEEVFLGGFYSDISASSIIGTVYMRLDPNTLQIVHQHFDKLDPTFLGRYLSQKQIHKGRELVDFYLDKLVLRSDGGILLFSEQFYNTYASSSMYYGYYAPGVYYRDRMTYHYNDVAILSLNNEGKIEWTSIVEKKQSSEFPQQLSYVPIITPDKVVIFYRYNLRGVGSNIYYQVVSEGKINTQPKAFFNDFSSRDYFYRSACEQISNDEAILVIYKARGKLFTFYKISFE